MYKDFIKYINDQNLFEQGQRLLVGVSGGPDSVVLAHLIAKTGNTFALAHCNFNLRGTDSDEDERFVQHLADEMEVACFLSSFPTREYATENGISIEMAARNLRYNWFEKVRKENGFDRIVVGHHLDDVLETFILNLARGTGIRGLSGIKPVAGCVVRPLLFATRREIEQFALQQGISFRTDESNNDVNIKRNKVRHLVIPLFEELNPSFRKNLEKTIGYLNQAEVVFMQEMEKVRNELVKPGEGWDTIPLAQLKKLKPLSLYLYEVLRPYRFNSDVVNDIENALDGEPGRCFYSPSHRLVYDRDALIITKKASEEPALFYIDKDQSETEYPIHLKIGTELYGNGYKIPATKLIATFDAGQVIFPLVIRKWKQGEYFRPLGMTGLKKISDFFIDEKYSIPEKENAWILCSGDRVMWIIGKRIDDRFKLTPQTRQVLRIEIVND